MIVEHSRDPRWLSNSWLVGDRRGGHAVLVDSGAPMEPLLAALAEHRLELTHVLCTHHHHDHVQHNAAWRARTGCAVCGGAAERERFADLDVALAGGEVLESGALAIRALHVPGHTTGQLAFVVDEAAVFTGDTLFAGSVGGTRAPGHGTYEQLRASVLDVLLALPPATRVYPGHMEPTTVGRERDANPFVRFWRGLDPAPRPERVAALDRPAELLLEARDYDGGTKCIVRFDGDGATEVVPGSRVRRG